jgi:hypothetical protein
LKKGKISKKLEIERQFAPQKNADVDTRAGCFHAVLMSIEDFMA